jgi:predicted permease
MSTGERIYRFLLRGYPAEFRATCERELIDYYRRDRQHPRYRGLRGNLRFWRHTLADWARTAWTERRGTAALPASGRAASRMMRSAPGSQPAAPWTERARPATGARAPEEPHGSRGTGLLPLRQAARGLRHDPAFSVVAVVTLAVGMAATTVVFTLVNGLLLTPLPLPEPERLVQVEERQRDSPDARMTAYANYRDLAAESDAFENLALYAYDTKTLTGIDAAQRLRSREVSQNFFATMGVAPVLGRTFTGDEMVDGQDQVVALSHALWSSAFGADPDVLGRTVQLDATPYTVVAVLPDGFDFPFGAQIWVPIWKPEDPELWRRQHRYRVTGRLAAGMDLATAQESLELIGARLANEFPETNQADYFVAFPLLDDYVGEARPILRVLAGAVGLVLAIACVNIAGLALARSTARRHEIAMRRALGASRGQLAGLVLSEGLVLGVAGGALGVLLAVAGLRGLLALAAADIPRVENVTMSTAVFLFAAGASVGAALLASLLPLLREARVGAAALIGGRASAERSAIFGRRALVIGEVALAVVLVAAAGLLGRSFSRLTAVPIGVETANVLTMNIALSSGKYPEPADTSRFFTRVLPEIEALPGIERAAVTLTEPANPFGWRNHFTIRDRPVAENELSAASYKVVSPGYFEALGIPLVAGRGLTRADEDDGAAVTVINRAAAERFFPDRDPLGALILGRPSEDSGWMRVVGVVEDVRQSLYEPAIPEAYVPLAADRVLGYILMVRTGGAPEQHAAAVREALSKADPDIPITRVETLEDRIATQTADVRLNAAMMATFAGIALALAAVGVYGVLSYSVALRRREFGVRTAIGATRARVVSLVLREALLICAGAVAVGTAGALAIGRLLAGMLFQIGGGDPLTLTLVVVTVSAVTVLASLAPAWRAASADPLAALRPGC